MQQEHAADAPQTEGEGSSLPTTSASADTLHEYLSDAATVPVELPYSERFQMSSPDQPMCDVKASEDIREDSCRAALTLFLVASCDGLGPLARQAMSYIKNWEQHAMVVAAIPKHGTKEGRIDHISELVAQLHERGALRIALVLVNDGISSDFAWIQSEVHEVRGLVSVATLGTVLSDTTCLEQPSIPTLHVLPPGVLGPSAWWYEAKDPGHSEAVAGVRRLVRQRPSPPTTTMKLLPPCAELWELDSS